MDSAFRLAMALTRANDRTCVSFRYAIDGVLHWSDVSSIGSQCPEGKVNFVVNPGVPRLVGRALLGQTLKSI